MKALQFNEYGGPEVLKVAEAPEPHAGPGQIRIAVKAAAVNPFDWKVRSGMLAGGKPLKAVAYLGLDGSGVVDEVGDGVTGVSVGDDVFGKGNNTQAEFAVLDAWAPKAPAIDWAVAGAVGVAAETAERALRLLDVKAGDTLFIDGGAGGVGATAAQYAIARGVRVIASAGQDNQGYLREIGATPVLYGEGLVDRVRAVSGAASTAGGDNPPETPRKGVVDAVLDVAGKSPVEDLISLVPEPSRVLSIGNYGAASAGARFSGGGAESQPMKALAEAAELLQQNKLVIKVQTFPLDRAAEAHRISEAGHVRGKLVLLPEG